MKRLWLYIWPLLMLASCRDDVMVVPMEDINTGGKTVKSEIIGMYLLNEGNMGSNKSTLDYLDLSGMTRRCITIEISIPSETPLR